MNREKTLEIENELDDCGYHDIGSKESCLDGHYTVEQLEAVIVLMKDLAEEQREEFNANLAAHIESNC